LEQIGHEFQYVVGVVGRKRAGNCAGGQFGRCNGDTQTIILFKQGGNLAQRGLLKREAVVFSGGYGFWITDTPTGKLTGGFQNDYIAGLHSQGWLFHLLGQRRFYPPRPQGYLRFAWAARYRKFGTQYGYIQAFGR